eukprot:TRINITY_DN40779_c0_g1_i1.p1 TRINITY_DN40779_c0_g1~~TRINITY_DN40779_c0_g1_i1.p1  ORF type:complete len:782 (+),score=139.70 TRINITY_DN40779_c0_g1_i1:52-2346(+)
MVARPASVGLRSRADLDDSLCRTREIAAAVRQLAEDEEDVERTLSQEILAHIKTKEKLKSTESELISLREAFEKELRQHTETKSALEEAFALQCKLKLEMKAMTDDHVTMRLQNEALQAELDVHKRSFAVNINWATRHAELVAKHEDGEKERLALLNKTVELRSALDTSITAHEESSQLQRATLEALERAREEIARQGEKSRQRSSEEQAAASKKLSMLTAQLRADNDRRRHVRRNVVIASERSAIANDRTFTRVFLVCWRAITNATQCIRGEKKERSMVEANRRISDVDFGRIGFCLAAWSRQVQADRYARIVEVNLNLQAEHAKFEARAKLEWQETVARIDKQLGKDDSGILFDIMILWRSECSIRVMKESKKAECLRRTDCDCSAVKSQCFNGWFSTMAPSRAARTKKVLGYARANRVISSEVVSLQVFCITFWFQCIQAALKGRRAKNNSFARALYIISEQAHFSKCTCFRSWTSFTQARRNRNGKVQAIERAIAWSSRDVLTQVFDSLWNVVNEQRVCQTTKSRNMLSALRSIKSALVGLQVQVLLSWARAVGDARRQHLCEALDHASSGAVDEASLQKMMAETAQLRIDVEEAMSSQERFRISAEAAERRLSDTSWRLAERDREIARLTEELEHSRQKAMDINEELARLGAFLLRPQRQSTRVTKSLLDATTVNPKARDSEKSASVEEDAKSAPQAAAMPAALLMTSSPLPVLPTLPALPRIDGSASRPTSARVVRSRPSSAKAPSLLSKSAGVGQLP